MAFDLATGERRNPNPIVPTLPGGGCSPGGCIDGSAIRAAPVWNSLELGSCSRPPGATPRGRARPGGLLALGRIIQSPADDPRAQCWAQGQELVAELRAEVCPQPWTGVSGAGFGVLQVLWRTCGRKSLLASPITAGELHPHGMGLTETSVTCAATTPRVTAATPSFGHWELTLTWVLSPHPSSR